MGEKREEEKWVRVFTLLNEHNILLLSLVEVTKFVFSLPGTPAPEESECSFMNRVWSLDRN
jgi:hypothetical protein